MDTVKANNVKMVNSDTAANKLLRKGWELMNVFPYGNVIAYILVKNCEPESINAVVAEKAEKTA